MKLMLTVIDYTFLQHITYLKLSEKGSLTLLLPHSF